MKIPNIERFGPAVLIISGALLFFVAFHSQFAILHEKEPTKPIIYEDQINDHGKKLLKDAKVEGSYSFDNRGLRLAPGQKVRITYTFFKDPLFDVWLEMRFYANPYVSNQVVVIRQDRQESWSTENKTFFAGMPAELTQHLWGAKEFALILSAEAKPDAPRPMLVFDSIRIISAPRANLPSLPLFISIISALLLLWYWLSTLGGFSPIYKLLVCELFLIALLLFVTSVTVPVGMTILIFVPIGALLALRWWKKRDAELGQLCILFAFLIILWIGTFLRWGLFMQSQNAPCEPDCETYLSLAARLPSLFETDFREPLFIWIVRVFTSLTTVNSLNLRLMTVLFSVLCIIATYEVGRRLLGNAAALLGSLALAVSPMMVLDAQRGLRLELTILTVLPFYYFAMRKSARATLSESLEIGSWAGLNHLNILSSYMFTIPLMVYKFIRDRFSWWSAALAILLSVLIVTPHLLHNKKRFGDPFYSVNIHAKYYQNREFGGSPGFPTAEEILQNGYVGPPTTSFHYVFGLHSLPDVAVSSIKGWWTIYVEKFTAKELVIHPTFLIPYVLGMLFLLFERRRDLLLGYFLLAASLFFVVGKMPPMVPQRLTDHIVPVGFLIAGYGVVRLTGLAAHLIRRGRTTKNKILPRSVKQQRRNDSAS